MNFYEPFLRTTTRGVLQEGHDLFLRGRFDDEVVYRTRICIPFTSAKSWAQLEKRCAHLSL
jgi:hypothetical protein